ncbi:MAG: molybdate ABC transporter substrate-binding protein [Hyphomicrobiaceae bacterium]
MARRPRPAHLIGTVVLGLLAVTIAGSQAAHAAESIVVFAAASLKNALDEISAAWSRSTGHTARLSLAGSSQLAKQIQMRAPADVFVSAMPKWMDVIEADGLIEPGTRHDIVGNRLVLIAHGRNAPPLPLSRGFDLVAALAGGKLAMAMVDAVPAGIYGKAALNSLSLWDAVASHVAQADNVRAALALVARGEAPFGIVYATDAAASDNVTIVATFPADAHPPIVYPAAVLAHSGAKEAARSMLAFLKSEAAAGIFAKHGFTPAPRSAVP